MDSLQMQPQENLWIPSEVNFPSCTVFSSLLSLAPNFAVHALPSENRNVHVFSRAIFGGAPSSHVTLEHWFSITPSLFHQEYWRCRLKKGLSIHFIPLSSHSMQPYRMHRACYANTSASILLLCCGPSQDVHEWKSEAWIIDESNDLLHNAVFSFFHLQLFLCDKKNNRVKAVEKSVVKLGEHTWDFSYYLFNTDRWLLCLSPYSK